MASIVPIEFTTSEHRKWETLKDSHTEVELKLWTGIELEYHILKAKELFIDIFPELFPSHEVAKHLINQIVCGKKFCKAIPIYLEHGSTFDGFLISFTRVMGISSTDKTEEIIVKEIFAYLQTIPKVLIFIDNFEVISNRPIDYNSLKITRFLKSLPSNCKILLTILLADDPARETDIDILG